MTTTVTHIEGTTMSRTIHSYANRVLAVAGFLGMATLVAPAATHAQITSRERALSSTTPFFSPSEATDAAAAQSRTADGESALLGRSAGRGSIEPKVAAGSLGVSGPVNGEQALLSRRHLGPISPLPLRH
jgi:hypothetical protein